MPEKPYAVTDNSASIGGRGWRIAGPTGFCVIADDKRGDAEYWCDELNAAYSAGRAAAESEIERLQKTLAETEAAYVKDIEAGNVAGKEPPK